MAALAEGRYDDVEVERITLDGDDGVAVAALHARPTGMPDAGIVVHPDIMGIRPLFDDLCRRLATHGLAVCSPEPFARLLASGVELTDGAQRMAHVTQLDDDVQLSDLARAADRLVVDDGIDGVSVLGFCLGGMYALYAAATGRFDRAVACYGMLRVPDTWRRPGRHDALDIARDVCPTLAIFGDADPYTPTSDIDALRTAWSDRSDCEIVVYPDADHGFVHDPERPTHRADHAADAWRRALAFLDVS